MTYFTHEEKKLAIKRLKTKYMLTKLWFCHYCNRNYQLAVKKKHQINSANIYFF